MRCDACNAVVAQDSAFCPRCGAPLGATQPPALQSEPPTDAQAGWAAPPPFTASPAPQGWGTPAPPWQGTAPTSGTNGLAIASLVTGIAGFAMCLGPLGSVPALITGYMAKRQIDESGGAQDGRSMAVAGIVLGWIGVAVFVVAIVGFVLVLIFSDPDSTTGSY